MAVDIIALGGLGGRVDQAFSLLHQLYASAEGRSSTTGKIFLVTENSISFVLEAGHHTIHASPSDGYMGENVGIIPVGRPATVSTNGLEWDLTDWETEFGKQVSTSNHIKSDVIIVNTDAPVLFTVELSDHLPPSHQ